MHYTAASTAARRLSKPSARAKPAASDAARGKKRTALLRGLGAAVRARRTECGLTLKALASSARVSERFLVQLETGDGNISVARLQDVAEALETSAAHLLSFASPSSLAPFASPLDSVVPARGIVALVGLRGAGKSTIGAAVAKRMGVPFVELDVLVAGEAGMALSTIFEIHGDAYFRRIEREALRKFLDANDAAVLATGGSIVTAPETFEVLRKRTTTVWLKARAEDHWARVVAQGDVRPMKNRANAMSELKGLLRARKPLYAQADHVVDTSSLALDEATTRVIAAVR
jgi:XRE family aerobic/anaerobic benzoate catabolism transcriptional regulator